MNSFRISKYDPDKRAEPGYLESQWTSISDVGDTFDGGVLTMNEYLRVEGLHLSFIREFLSACKADVLKIEALEDHKGFGWENGEEIFLDGILEFSKGALREWYWAKLESNKAFIHFGYDYYVYVGTSLDYATVKEIAVRNKLYCEDIPSPYMSTGL